MNKSLRLKLLSLFFLSLLVALFVSFFLNYVMFRPYYIKYIEERLLTVVDLVELQIHEEDLQSVLEAIDLERQVGIVIADRHLHNVILSYQEMRILEDRLERLDRQVHSLITNELEKLEHEHIFETLATDGEFPRLVLVKKLSTGSYCILTHPLESLESSIDATSKFHLMAGAVACFIGGISTFFFSKQFTKPIIEISQVTEGLSQQNFQQSIQYSSQDELGQLAHSINVLAQKLELNQNALNNEIAFQKILSQNMSHELKTPIAVIRGYIEALSYGVVEEPEQQQEYIQIVLEECDRMTVLINKMLQLSKLTAYHDMEKKSFTAGDFTEALLEKSRTLLIQREIPFTYEISDLVLWGNIDLLLQGVGNFLTNAVKYGDQKEIHLTIREEGEDTLIIMYNSGCSIPEDELGKIFEVFYMADKVRSRENNSHGLGLSVTKTVADLHNGTTYCENVGKGVQFVLKIPQKEKNYISPK